MNPAITAISEAFRARDSRNIIRITSDVIASILEGTNRCHKCVDGSFSHKLGFDKFILIDEGVGGRQLRIHCWRDTIAEMPHDHPWNFESLVLTGEILSTEYRRSFSGEAYERMIVRSDFVTNGFSYHPAEDQTLVVARRRRIPAGEAYSMGFRAIHATHVTVGPATTIFLRSHVLRHGSSSYISRTAAVARSTLEYRPAAFPSTLYLERLTEVFEVLTAMRLSPAKGDRAHMRRRSQFDR